MAIYYSATTNSFYDSNIIEITQMPEDSKIVTDANYKALMDAQCDGHVITANSDGTPCAITQQCGPCSGLIHDLTIATANKLGHVKGGGNVSIDANGVMNANISLSGYALDSNVVHKSGDENINGIKTFNGTVVQKKDGIIKNDNVDITTTPSSNFFTHLFFADKNNVTNAFIRYGQITNGINELNLFVRDKDLKNYGVSVNTNNEFIPVLNNTYSLGSADAKWKKIYSDDVVHTSGNETINGTKTFNNDVTVCGDVYDKNVQADLTQIPTSNIYTQYRFIDKNNKTMGYVQHVQRTTGINQLSFLVRDSDNVDYGFFVTTDKALLPAGNNTYSLGASGSKWANVYATTFNGNLKGNADSSTKATQDSTGQQINKTYIKELSVSGRTITYKRGDNTTGTITTQDTNTTYSKLSQFTNDTGFITSSGSCNYATTAGSADNGVDSWGGSWIRFKNGIQMCWGAGTFEKTISYPKAFKVNPALICTPFSELQQSLVVNFSLKTNTLFACRLWNVHAGSWQTDGYFDWIAIGIWK